MWTTRLPTRLVVAALVGMLGLCVAGTGVAEAANASNTSGGRAVNLRITVQPGATAPSASFTDTFMVTNLGQDSAHDVRISVPFDSSAVQLLGVQFNQPGAWVTSVAPNAFQAHLGVIGSNGQDVQVVASFAELPGHTSTSTLPTAINFHYSNNGQTHSGTVNTQLLPMQASAAVQAASASMVVVAGDPVSVNSAIFAPGEPVALWYNAPDGQTLPLYVRNGRITTERQHKELMADGTTHDVNNGAYLSADAQGTIAAMLSTRNLEPGAYTLIAHGLNSSASAVVAFQLR
jgi:hypothetical protein